MEQLEEIYTIIDSMSDNLRNGYMELSALGAEDPTSKNLDKLDDTVTTLQNQLNNCMNILVELGAGSPTEEGVPAFESALNSVQSSLQSCYNTLKNMGVGEGEVTLDKMSEAVNQFQTDVNSAWQAAEAKGATIPETPDVAGLANAIASISAQPESVPVGEYGRITYYTMNTNNEIEFISLALDTENDFNALCDSTNSATAQLTLKGVTFDKSHVVEFTSNKMPDAVPDYFLYRFEKMAYGTVTIPSNVTSIGSYFMANCWAWNNLVDYSRATALSSIGPRFCAWQYSFNKAVDLSATQITSIPERFFQSALAINSTITLPNTVTSVGDYFLAWSHLLSTGQPLVIPDSVVSIGNYFFYCDRQYNNMITIGAGVQTIGNYFLYSCNSLRTQVIFNGNFTSIGNYFMGYTASYDKTVELTGNHATLGTNFMTNTSMNSANSSASENLSVTLSGSWTSIGTRFMSFQAWASPNISINGDDLTIGTYFFWKNGNTSKSTISITGSTSGSLSYFVSYNPSWNGTISLAGGVTELATSCFCSLPAFSQTLALPDSIVTIGNSCLYKMNCAYAPTGLDNVTTIGNYFLYGCTNMNNIVSLPSTQSVGNYMGAYSSLGFLPKMPNVQSIGTYFFAFSRVYDISEWNNYVSLSSIGSNCLRDCYGITPLVTGSLIMPSTLATVPDAFMAYCYNWSGVVYVSKTTMFESSVSTFSSGNYSHVALYTNGIVFTGQGGSLAQMTIGSSANAPLRKTSYVSS
ncbi:MAG: leucine-rich repeat domain-containing protein [Acetobacter sp.]|nr:leucine-rich repeat domain-containing protein [Acetobacter sp.]